MGICSNSLSKQLMRVTQGHVSKGVHDFPFLTACGLTEYMDRNLPCVFFGCYTEDDLTAIVNHQGKKIIFWCGQDSIESIFYGRYQFLKDCIHVSHMPNVVKALTPFLTNVRLINPLLFGGHFKPSKLGTKVYAYAPGHLLYHNTTMIKYLTAKLPFDFIIGDGLVPQEEWLSGYGNELYDDCFVGLCLSGFAGGGQTVIQLGLKGRKVINNVLLLPNCIAWSTVQEIEEIINLESLKIGTENLELALNIESLIDNHSWLELTNYE